MGVGPRTERAPGRNRDPQRHGAYRVRFAAQVPFHACACSALPSADARSRHSLWSRSRCMIGDLGPVAEEDIVGTS